MVLNGSIYIGAYDSSTASECKIRGREVICDTADPRFPGVIEFTKRGPPYETVFDGQVEEITFGNKLKSYWCNEHRCARLKRLSTPWMEN